MRKVVLQAQLVKTVGGACFQYRPEPVLKTGLFQFPLFDDWFLIFDFESCFHFNLYVFTTNPAPLLEMRRLFHHWLVCAETYWSPLVAGSLIGHKSPVCPR